MHQGSRTKYDEQIVAQGVGNCLCGLLGVLPRIGVIGRSNAKVNAGGQTRSSPLFIYDK